MERKKKKKKKKHLDWITSINLEYYSTSENIPVTNQHTCIYTEYIYTYTYIHITTQNESISKCLTDGGVRERERAFNLLEYRSERQKEEEVEEEEEEK